MKQNSVFQLDPKLDLVLERTVDVPVSHLWAGWTQPELLKKWFCPAPWRVTECEMDLRPGGLFRTVMQGPEGQSFPNMGCFLEIVENKRLVWTDCLLPGFRPLAGNPVSGADLHFTAVIQFEPQGQGAKYTVYALHRNEEDRKRHEEMGFHGGWNMALDQLLALYKKA
jgi:uncharacterized protein YndB with AHSA1/START domain